MREVIKKFLSDRFGYEEEALTDELMQLLIEEAVKEKKVLLN